MGTLRRPLSPLVQGVETIDNRHVPASFHEAEGDYAVFRESFLARGHRLPTKVGLLKNPRGHTLSNNTQTFACSLAVRQPLK